MPKLTTADSSVAETQTVPGTRESNARIDFNRNNFDLIRLLAALQVAFGHIAAHLSAPEPVRGWAIDSNRIPGVPIFFFISGMLISRSYERRRNIREFSRNRFLRIYPALWICWIIGIVSVLLIDRATILSASKAQFTVWTICQNSIFQFFNPSFLRGYGVGVLNGSLWTISIELQFYILVPLLYLALRRLSPRAFDAALVVGIALFVGINVIYAKRHEEMPDLLSTKLFGVSFLPWLYMFLTGILVQRNFARIVTFVAGTRYFIALGAFIGCAFIFHRAGIVAAGNTLSPVAFFVLVPVVFGAAYAAPGCSEAVLKRNDISYGCYIYHMLVVNAFVQLGWTQSWLSIGAALAGTIALGALSWVVVERRFLSRKKNPLRAVPGAIGA